MTKTSIKTLTRRMATPAMDDQFVLSRKDLEMMLLFFHTLEVEVFRERGRLAGDEKVSEMITYVVENTPLEQRKN